MAGRGPAPKGRNARERDTPTFDELADGGEVYGDPLPAGVLPDGEEWHPQTVKWWESIRRFPLLRDEPEIGWQFLVDTALMHHTMWTKGRWEFASELRLRVAKYGATPEDRMRLKIKVATPPSEPAAAPTAPSDGDKVTSITSRRSRLTG